LLHRINAARSCGVARAAHAPRLACTAHCARAKKASVRWYRRSRRSEFTPYLYRGRESAYLRRAAHPRLAAPYLRAARLRRNHRVSGVRAATPLRAATWLDKSNERATCAPRICARRVLPCCALVGSWVVGPPITRAAAAPRLNISYQRFGLAFGVWVVARINGMFIGSVKIYGATHRWLFLSSYINTARCAARGGITRAINLRLCSCAAIKQHSQQRHGRSLFADILGLARTLERAWVRAYRVLLAGAGTARYRAYQRAPLHLIARLASQQHNNSRVMARRLAGVFFQTSTRDMQRCACAALAPRCSSRFCVALWNAGACCCL